MIVGWSTLTRKDSASVRKIKLKLWKTQMDGELKTLTKNSKRAWERRRNFPRKWEVPSLGEASPAGRGQRNWTPLEKHGDPIGPTTSGEITWR